jgi:hypothetical protein
MIFNYFKNIKLLGLKAPLGLKDQIMFGFGIIKSIQTNNMFTPKRHFSLISNFSFNIKKDNIKNKIDQFNNRKITLKFYIDTNQDAEIYNIKLTRYELLQKFKLKNYFINTNKNSIYVSFIDKKNQNEFKSFYKNYLDYNNDETTFKLVVSKNNINKLINNPNIEDIIFILKMKFNIINIIIKLILFSFCTVIGVHVLCLILEAIERMTGEH